jgi:DNA-directed RNA polymerase specialized sigma24 family protein
MRPPRIDDTQLHRLLVEEGCSQRDAANLFGINEAAISKAVKRLNLNLGRHIGLERAKDVADHGLNVVGQLQGINGTIQEELRWATQEARREGGDRHGLQKVMIELSSEVRNQLGFQLDILRSLYDFQPAAEFQQDVLDAIGQISPETRQAIIERLIERRALRSTVVLAHR